MNAITRLTPSRRLAQSRQPLSGALVDSARREDDADAKCNDDDRDRVDQLALHLDDSGDGRQGASPRSPGVAPSRYAVAVLLGRALDADRTALARLQDADATTLIQVPSADMIEPVRALLKQYVLLPANVVSASELRNGSIDVAEPGMAAIFTDRDDGKPATAEQMGDLVKAARAGCALIGISTDPERLLSPELLCLATTRIRLPRFDDDTVRAVIRAATGADPGSVNAEVAGVATLQALDLAVRADLGAAASLDRLRLLAGDSSKDDTSALPLAKMHGLGEAKTWALDLAADLQAYGRGELPWNQIAACATIWSRPGCGKTAVARALAREAGCAFIATSYAQWQAYREGHLGHVTQAIRNTFAEARKRAPCIVFIDEIDTLGTRGSSKRDEEWWRAIINALLEELDGFQRREGVAVIAACNDPARLDPALVRAGRLDRMIEIPLPDVPALAGIFRAYLRDELAGEDLIDIALNAHGGTGADVERSVRDARAIARRAGRPLSKSDLVEVVRGARPELPPTVRRRIAYHEAGHAIAIVSTGIGTPRSLSISDKGGLSMNDPGERRALTRAHLENHLVILLAGRAAEVLMFGEGTAGAGGNEDSDLGGATKLATQLETAYGLGSSGLLYLPVEPERQFLLAPDVRGAVAKTLQRIHAAALDLLAHNRVQLDALAKALFDRGYLDTEAIREIIDAHPLQPVPERTPTKDEPGARPASDPGLVDGDVEPAALRP